MPKFKDIKQLTDPGSYRINVQWNYLENALAEYLNPGCGAVLDMDPPFQRAHVWTQEQQTAYVEFCLRGGKSSDEILFNCVGWNHDFRGPFVLVDGKQRLQAVRQFLANEVPVFGQFLFKDFTDNIRMLRPNFIFRINNLPTEEAVLKWYLELNAGGTPHTKEELDKVRRMLEKK
jgi:hypothetical protein